MIWSFQQCELCYPQNSPMTRQAGGERLLPKGSLSSERCFFKSIFSMADSSGHSSGKKYRVASVLWLDVEWRCSSKGMSHMTDRSNPIKPSKENLCSWFLEILTSVWIVRKNYWWYKTHFHRFIIQCKFVIMLENKLSPLVQSTSVFFCWLTAKYGESILPPRGQIYKFNDSGKVCPIRLLYRLHGDPAKHRHRDLETQGGQPPTSMQVTIHPSALRSRQQHAGEKLLSLPQGSTTEVGLHAKTLIYCFFQLQKKNWKKCFGAFDCCCCGMLNHGWKFQLRDL